MEAAIIIILGALAYICWNILAIKDGIEQTNAKLKNIENNLDNIDTRLYDLKRKGQPVELPVRLPENVLENLLSETRQAIEEYQIEKEEFQVKLKAIKEKY